VVLRGLGSNFVIFGGRLIEFCLFPFSLLKAEILLRAFLWEKNPEYPDFFSGLFLRKPRRLREKVRSIRTFSPDFFSETLETPGISAEISDFPLRFA
jgi:hypothetical protein